MPSLNGTREEYIKVQRTGAKSLQETEELYLPTRRNTLIHKIAHTPANPTFLDLDSESTIASSIDADSYNPDLELVSSDGEVFLVEKFQLFDKAPGFMALLPQFPPPGGTLRITLTDPIMEHSRVIELFLGLLECRYNQFPELTPSYILQLRDVYLLAKRYGYKALMLRIKKNVRHRIRSRAGALLPQVMTFACAIEDDKLAKMCLKYSQKWVVIVESIRQSDGQVKKLRSYRSDGWNGHRSGMDAMDPTVFPICSYVGCSLPYLWAWVKATRLTYKTWRGVTDWPAVADSFERLLQSAKSRSASSLETRKMRVQLQLMWERAVTIDELLEVVMEDVSELRKGQDGNFPGLNVDV